MNTITTELVNGRVLVAILGVQGDLDASNYQDLIASAKELCSAGTQYILLDLTNTRYMSSSGLVALHSIALLLQGEKPLDPEDGWSALHSVGKGLQSGGKQAVKLLNPSPKVDRTLEIAGLKEFFEVYTDKEQAIASF